MDPPSAIPNEAGELLPRRAAVTPRVRIATEGASLPLEYHVRGMLRAGACGNVNLWGPIGAGKTVALEHLAEVFRGEKNLSLNDANTDASLDQTTDRLVVFTSRERSSKSSLVALQMSPWTDDDLIEYLVSAHRGRVASVMQRATASPNRGELGGLPELWRIALDVLATDDAMEDIWQALRWRMYLELSDDARLAASAFSFCELARSERDLKSPAEFNARLAQVISESRGEFDPRVARLIRHRCMQLPLAADFLASELCADGAAHLAYAMPLDLKRHTANWAKALPPVVEALESVIKKGSSTAQSNAATILHAMGMGWRPEEGCVPYLGDADLSNAHWPSIHLPNCFASGANFMGANLECARFENANLAHANFAQANLHGAVLNKADANYADFTGADLRVANANGAKFWGAAIQRADLGCAVLQSARFGHADLTDARFFDADLTYADLRETTITGANFDGGNFNLANLSGLDLCQSNFSRACFERANLEKCQLEYMSLADAKFQCANLEGALLSGSSMPRANFNGSNLSGTGLADIDWEGADLRNADLRGASFHAGSTRSGLVGSTIAGEGSKTGFYTDDFNDRDFKRPEEIRKANLRGADLRGANIEHVDFYLVDLRDACYSKSQGKWFRRCGAIL